MHLSLLTAVFAFWLLVNSTASSDLKEAVRYKRENSKDQDLAASCLWLCDCFRKPQKGHVHIVVQCQQMLQFPVVTPEHTSILRLNDNFIGRITEKSLQLDSLKSLEILECTNCRITTIDINAFRHLHKLRTIDLKDNSIAHLSPTHFHDQKNLALLLLKGNSGLDCVPLKKELERRTGSPVKVDCDDIAQTQDAVIEKSSGTTTENVDVSVTKAANATDKKTSNTTENTNVTKTGNATDKKANTTTKNTDVTETKIETAGKSDTKETVEDVSEPPTVTNDDSSQGNSQTSTDAKTTDDAKTTKSESEFVVIGSIIGGVVAVVVGVIGMFMLWKNWETCKV